MPRWETVTIWILRVALLATAALFMAEGQWLRGMFCVIAVALAVTPALIVHNAKFAWPFELELVLLWFSLADLTLGHLMDLYVRIAWYDKAIHFSDSILVGFVAFFAVYLAHYLRRDRPWLDSLAILLATLGLGALWETVEFASDQLFGTYMQGSPELSPLADTMWDLIVDGLGGVLAAILGPLYMASSKRSRQRVAQFAAHRDARKRSGSVDAAGMGAPAA
jgi:hypothetical protein